MPVYGRGENVRDWLFVEVHARALWIILNKGRIGECYNVGGDELRNIDLVSLIVIYSMTASSSCPGENFAAS